MKNLNHLMRQQNSSEMLDECFRFLKEEIIKENNKSNPDYIQIRYDKIAKIKSKFLTKKSKEVIEDE